MDAQMIRHGDLTITRVANRQVKGLKRAAGTALAIGTATGHSHRVKPAANATLYELPEGMRLLRVRKPVAVEHEEHKSVQLAPGDYVVARKRQYDREHGWVNWKVRW